MKTVAIVLSFRRGWWCRTSLSPVQPWRPRCDLDARECAGEQVIEGKRRGSWATLTTTCWQTNIPNRLSQPFPLSAMGTQDPARIIESARALRALEPSLLLVGHGPAVHDPGATMNAAIKRANQ